MSDAFHIVVLGCTGGPKETNLSGYLLSPADECEWIALDCGSLLAGIDYAFKNECFPNFQPNDPTFEPAADFFLHHLKAYLISHAHLDHIAGLVLNSQVDRKKALLGIGPTIDNLRDHVFNGRIWPNYGDEGYEPILRLYHYVRLPLHKEAAIPDTSMSVESFLLSHPRGYPSTAFLVRKGEDYVLYFGDTSSDKMEIEKHVSRIWRRVAPLIREGRLRGILLECSFPREDADQTIYGHLDTKLMQHELHHLAEITGKSLEGLKVVVTHRKETLRKGLNPLKQIEKELTESNDLRINYIFPTQGGRIEL